MDSVLLSDSSFHNPVLKLENSSKSDSVRNVLKGFIHKKSVLKNLQNKLNEEMDLGLALNPSRKSSLIMANTYVTKLPDGSESGDFISLDLGTTNFRVVLSQFRPQSENVFKVKHYTVPNQYRRGESKNLFDFIASCIADFVKEYLSDKKETIPLGFTFSFPMSQKAIDIGILETWTKDFDCPDAVGKNAAQLLQEAISRSNDLNINIVAILNDATGTLVQGVYLDPECAISMILGTGSNACYLEKVERIEKWTDRELHFNDVKEVIIDTECGAFGDNGVIDFVKTQFDKELDQESLFPNSFTFEKLFSGQFLGDIVRRVFISLAQKQLLFEGKITEKLKLVNSFTTTDISNIESNEDQSYFVELANRLGYKNFSTDDIEIIKYVCAVVSVRGATLLSACMAALVERIDKPNVTIAIDGSVYKYHPKFHTLMTDFIKELIPNRKFKLILAEDGSGKGAGLVAAIAQKIKK